MFPFLRAAAVLAVAAGVTLPCTADASVPDVASQPLPEQAPANCRNFTMPVLVDGQQRQAVGQLCRQPDGSWQVTQNTPGLPVQVYTLPAQVIAAVTQNSNQYYWTDPWGFGPPFFAGGCCIFGSSFHHFHRGFFHSGFHHGFHGGHHGGGHGHR